MLRAFVPLVLVVTAAAGCDPSAEKIDALQTRVASLEAKLAERERTAGDADDPLTQLSARVAALQTQLDTAKSEQEASATKIDTVAEEVEQIKNSVNALQAATPTPVEDPPVAAGEIGVPECDEYVVAYRKCIEDKLPVAVRETTRKALATSVEAWKKAAAIPGARAGLAEAC